MCYYNGQKVTHVEFIRLKELEKTLARYDFLQHDLKIGFEYGPTAVLKKVPDQQDFEVTQMEWGFIPNKDRWPFIKTRQDLQNMRNGFKDGSGKFHPPITTLNAMAEELLLPNKIYRDAALHRRCLVLSSGFYEWRHIFPLNKKTGQPLKTANKIPYFITLKEQPYFYMLGIWEPWTDQETGEYVESLSIVTTAANPLMRQVHNSKMRMPTIPTEDLGYEWVFGDLSEKRITEIATFQYSAGLMEACPIAKDFRNALEPAKPFSYEDLPALELNL